MANYGARYSGFSSCEWVSDSYVTGNNVGVDQGQVSFERTEGTITTVDKTFSFGIDESGGVVITGHHSSLVVDEEESNQYVFADDEE